MTDWISVKDRLPDPDQRVLCYSPVYKDVDETMLYRILSGQVLKYCSDVEYWKIPEPPNKINEQDDEYDDDGISRSRSEWDDVDIY